MAKKTIKRNSRGTAAVPEYLPDTVHVTLSFSVSACEWRALGEMAADVRRRTGIEDFDEFAVLRTSDSSEIARHMLGLPPRSDCECMSCVMARKRGTQPATTDGIDDAAGQALR